MQLFIQLVTVQFAEVVVHFYYGFSQIEMVIELLISDAL